jgi:endonuclease/exonuclease/phosphatase family metal-dependent hydrolase
VAASPPTVSVDAVRVATWNIHGAVGTDGRFDLARITAGLATMSADVWALQEIESRVSRSRGVDGFAVLSAAIGGHSVAARTICGPEGDYGHLLASRWPIEAAAIHDISHRRREPRHLIDGRIAGEAGALRLIAVHLDLARRARREQLAKLRALIEEHDPGCCIVLGDFNAPRAGTLDRLLADRLTPVETRATFPSRWPVLRLDRIWCRPAGLVTAATVPHAYALASDHLPVVADVDPAVWSPRRPAGSRAGIG